MRVASKEKYLTYVFVIIVNNGENKTIASEFLPSYKKIFCICEGEYLYIPVRKLNINIVSPIPDNSFLSNLRLKILIKMIGIMDIGEGNVVFVI